jgi:hypothetical protein
VAQRLQQRPPISFGLDFDDINAFIAATRGANLVGQTHLMAFGAGNQVPGFEGMMAAPVALAALAQFVFG